MDLRLPIGILFTIYGVMLVGYGLFTQDSAIYQKSLGLNINIGWGVVLLIFGLLMWFFAKRSQKTSSEEKAKVDSTRR